MAYLQNILKSESKIALPPNRSTRPLPLRRIVGHGSECDIVSVNSAAKKGSVEHLGTECRAAQPLIHPNVVECQSIAIHRQVATNQQQQQWVDFSRSSIVISPGAGNTGSAQALHKDSAKDAAAQSCLTLEVSKSGSLSVSIGWQRSCDPTRRHRSWPFCPSRLLAGREALQAAKGRNQHGMQPDLSWASDGQQGMSGTQLTPSSLSPAIECRQLRREPLVGLESPKSAEADGTLAVEVLGRRLRRETLEPRAAKGNHLILSLGIAELLADCLSEARLTGQENAEPIF